MTQKRQVVPNDYTNMEIRAMLNGKQKLKISEMNVIEVWSKDRLFQVRNQKPA